MTLRDSCLVAQSRDHCLLGPRGLRAVPLFDLWTLLALHAGDFPTPTYWHNLIDNSDYDPDSRWLPLDTYRVDQWPPHQLRHRRLSNYQEQIRRHSHWCRFRRLNSRPRSVKRPEYLHPNRRRQRSHWWKDVDCSSIWRRIRDGRDMGTLVRTTSCLICHRSSTSASR